MIIPIRNLAAKGIVTDFDAYDLGLDSLTMAVNVRMEQAHIERGPIARKAGPLPAAPRHALAYEDLNGSTQVHVVATDGGVVAWTPGLTTDLSPAYTSNISDAVVTSCESNGVVYINRTDRTPWYRSKAAISSYQTLDSYNSGNSGTQFSSNLRFNALRSTTGGYLVGINVTDGGTSIPTKVKWSTIATNFGLPPDDWSVSGINANNTASSGGENVLAEMTGSLVDGLARANSMILYGSKETWLMEFVGGNDIFNFRRLFESGVLNVNCVVEREGLHYVFGEDGDVYIHDGTGTKKSIATGRVKKFVNRSIVKSAQNKSFAVHNKLLNEILFCYVSNDQYCAFPYADGIDGCNRAAVYNYNADCWYFYDLPYVTSATVGPVASGLTYDKADIPYADVGGSWAGQGDNRNALLITSDAFAGIPQAVRTFDSPDSTATTGTIEAAANGPVTIMKLKMDMDELQASNPYASLRGTKRLDGLNVQCAMSPTAKPIMVTVGSSYTASEDPVWGVVQPVDNQTFRVDCSEQGQYLSVKMVQADTSAFRMSGYDLDVQILSRK